MNKIFLTFALIFASIVLFANTAAELIAEFEKLPKDKQVLLKSKHSFFTDENIEKFKKLTPPQQNQLVEKLNIDLKDVAKQLAELKKKPSAKKNDNKRNLTDEKRNRTDEDESKFLDETD